jgi:photosystem II stability/assembly factor-like uncharacterized protein
VVYLGANGGGVWKTTDGGQTWAPLTDNQPSLEIGALALDPTNPDIVYAGTNFSNAVFGNMGAGILKSSDGGSTWTVLPGPLPTGPGLEAYVQWLAVNPSNGNVVLVVDASSEGSAVYRSADGGNTWKQVIASSGVYGGQAVFDPADGNVAYATLGGLYKSTDGGNTWATALSSVPVLALAVYPSTPETVSVYVGALGSSSTPMYVTMDGGTTWTPLPGAPECQGILVNPADPEEVFAGSSSVSVSTDGGSTWGSFFFGASGVQSALGVSADGSVLYVGSEWGAWKLTGWPNGVLNSADLNPTLAITNFYDIAIHPTDPTKGIGGAQSDGMDLYSGGLSWQSVACDNGGDAAFDFLNPNTIYVTCTPAPGILKSTDGSNTFSPSQDGIDTSEFQPGLLPALAMDPSDPQQLYVAAGHVWQSTDGAASWTAISPVLGPGLGTWQSLAIAPSDPNTVYLGNTQGVWVTTSANQGSGAAWVNIGAAISPIYAAPCSSYGPNCAYLTRVAVDFSSASTAYVTFASYVSGHVYKTTDLGDSWTDISGNLPNIRVNDIAIDPDVPNTLYIATEQGVYSTADGGKTWNLLGTGLPNVVTTALKLHRPTRILRAATYGRSVWDLQLGAVASPVILSSTSLSFSQAGSQTVTLTNAGTAPLTFYSITAPTAFSQANTCGVRLASAAKCTITVTFAPPDSGSYSGGVTITDDAPGSPQSISVAGPVATPSDFSLNMASGSPGSVTVTAGQTATYTLSVAPQGGFNQSVSMTCSGAPSLATCSVSPSSASLSGGNPASVTVSVTTTAPSIAMRSRFRVPPRKPGIQLTLPHWATILAFIGAFFGLIAFSNFRRIRLSTALAFALLIFVMSYSVACGGAAAGGGGGVGGGGGGGSGKPGTPSGTYTLVVTGTNTSGTTTLTHNITLKLTVS